MILRIKMTGSTPRRRTDRANRHAESRRRRRRTGRNTAAIHTKTEVSDRLDLGEVLNHDQGHGYLVSDAKID